VVFFPLDRQLALWEKHWSEEVAKLAVWLGGLVSFEQAAEILRRVGQIVISESSVWRRVKRWGEEFKALEDAERVLANALPRTGSSPAQRTGAQGRKGVAIDGSMIHIRGEGWKECKLGCVFDVEVHPRRDVETNDFVERAHAVHTSYTAYLGGPEPFGQLLWAEAKRRDWEKAVETQALGDAAAWIWGIVQDYFYDSRPLVDWYHGTEHLASAAQMLHGEGTLAATRWYNAQQTVLFQGHAARIAQALVQAAPAHKTAAQNLAREADYFERYHRRMNYLETREEGWLIGSGVVESAAKQYKARLAGPGMHWSRPGAERLLPVRSTILSDRFDSTWRCVYKSPHN
jgi:hypothetical protein